jgi:hypothetical protein
MSSQSPIKKFMDTTADVFILDTSTSTPTGQPIEILPAVKNRSVRGRFIPKKSINLFDVGQVVEGKDRFVTLTELQFNEIVLINGTYHRVVEKKEQKLFNKSFGFEHRLEIFRH